MSFFHNINKFFAQYNNALNGKYGGIGYLISIVPVALISIIILWILTNKLFGSKVVQNRKIHLVFFRRIFKMIAVFSILLLILLTYDGFPRLTRFLGGATLVFGGVVGVAAQDVLKDIIAGLMLSIYQPFDIGDRLFLSDIPKAVIVEDLTMRHVVLRAMDGMRFIVPNSEMNNFIIQNTSYRQDPRATYLTVPVGYDSDLRLAIDLMRKAARNCPYTCPGNKNNVDLDGYGDVYFSAIQESAYIFNMTIWSEPDTDNDLAVSEVYHAIVSSFNENGIEIPYNYVNVVDGYSTGNEQSSYDDSPKADGKHKQNKRLGLRNLKIRTDRLTLSQYDGYIEQLKAVNKKAVRFVGYHQFEASDANIIYILSEELMNFAHMVLGELSGSFWLEGTEKKVQIHLKERVSVNIDARDVFMDLSSSDKNEADMGLIDRIRYEISLYSRDREHDVSFTLDDMGNKDELEKTIITKLSDDVRVSMTEDTVHINIIWREKSK